MREEQAQAKSGVSLRRRLWWLIAARFILALALFGLSLLLGRSGAASGAGLDSLRSTFVFGLVVLSLSALYVAILRFSRVALQTQAAAQIFCDVMLVTWLTGMRGDLHSPYVALYIVIISVAGIFLGVRGALATSVGCAVCYTFVVFASAFGWLRVSAGDVTAASVPEVIGNVGLHDIAFFVVGLLASRLAERQAHSDVQLIKVKHALADLRALHERIVESIRSGLVTTDLDGLIYTFNAAAEEITGYSAEALRGKDVSILLGTLKFKIEESLRAAAEGTTSPRYEADCLTAEGLRLRLGYSIFPLFGETGARTGLVITFQDLTQVRALEETSRRQDRLAAVGRVAAGIAHEIRNPLAAMRGSIQVLHSEMNGDPAQAELMEIVLRESDRLNHIITDFLTYARPRQVSLADTDLREPLRETFTLLRHSPETRDGHIIEEDFPDTPVRAQADAAGLRQVFWNLSRNALSAMPEGGRLRVELRPTNYGRVRITFTDTGAGMSPEQVERLFEPFSSSTTGGTGLGLSIVYQIIRDHGGTINVRSREGHGTTIIIELPENRK
ncbi:MAG TPA: ATP-binding protein [Pyrinomonadaceae bacterium]|jgi:two-component system sensor histidine kinase PilS (NtrC family)|nr:ATP-binding protein [Pyrinomonadaceae bacterium]